MKTISVVIQKGGCGKTTIAYNIAHALALRGNRTLAVDLDPQGDMSGGFLKIDQVECRSLRLFEDPPALDPQQVRENLWLIGANRQLSRIERASGTDIFFGLKEALAPKVGQYDYVVVDTPPSMGVLPTVAMIASDYLLLPLQLEPLALKGMVQAHKTIQNIRKRNLNPQLRILGHLVNNANSSRALSRQALDKLKASLGTHLFPVATRTNVRLAEAISHHKSIFEYDSDGRAAADMTAVTDELLRRIHHGIDSQRKAG